MAENSVFEMLQRILSASNVCVIRAIKLWEIKWMLHAAFIGRLVRNEYKILAGKLEGKGEVWRPKRGEIDDIGSGF
jgi:hypothetical protein